MACILPKNLTAGLTFEKSVSIAQYPANDGWVLTVFMRGVASIDIVSTAEGALHKLVADAETTAEWKAGTYTYAARASRAGVVHEIDAGYVEVLPDLAVAEAGYDGRDHIRKVLDAIEAVIEQRATMDQERYVIAGQNGNRELWRTPISDLLKLRDIYKQKLSQQDACKTGGKFGRRIRVRLA